MKTHNFTMLSFLLLVSSFWLLISCQPKQGVSTAHNKKLLAVIADAVEARPPSLREGEAGGQSNVESIQRLTPIHFTTGSDTILQSELNVLASNISWLDKNEKAVLVLEGHCDERGGDRYNMQLGDRRARSVKSYLIKRGVGADRLIMVVSYGERVPLDPRHTKDAWRANRRVEFIVR